jgi:hypothetical protein|tara:strand:+ start:127 stop:303 length:177 start_codon:yes stop_codon:yes gene_type:complete
MEELITLLKHQMVVLVLVEMVILLVRGILPDKGHLVRGIMVVMVDITMLAEEAVVQVP